MPDSPFVELNLQELGQNLGAIRVRQHVNPLKKELQGPVKPITWNKVFDDPGRDLLVDIGSGYGRFLMLLNRREQVSGIQRNYLGLEIRYPVVERANKWAQLVNAGGKVWFELVNATKSLEDCVKDYPGKITTVTIQFPDPHVKRKHHKRRIVQRELTMAIAKILRPGGVLFVQTDVLEVALDMREQFERYVGHLFHHSSLHFQSIDESVNNTTENNSSNKNHADENKAKLAWKDVKWLERNPLGVPTEREVYVKDLCGEVYRMMLIRNEVEFVEADIPLGQQDSTSYDESDDDQEEEQQDTSNDD